MSIFNRGIATEANNFEENTLDEVYIRTENGLELLEVEKDGDSEERKPQ